MGKRWRAVRAQATLFIILGLVLLAVFSFALYARSLLVTDQLRFQAEQAVTAYIDANNINYYVTTCLRQTTDYALAYVGEHGGVPRRDWQLGQDYLLFTDQQGLQRTVSYALRENENELCSEYAQSPPAYPRSETRLIDLLPYYVSGPCSHNRRSGFLGRNTLPLLCYYYGENSYVATPTDARYPCPPWFSSMDEERNIQSWLQFNISEEMKRCVDFTILELNTNQTIKLDEESITTRIIYGYDGVHAITNFPFEVSIDERRSAQASKEFSYSSPVRLRAIYSYISDLATKEATDYQFVLSNDYDLSVYFDPAFFDVTILHDPCLHNPLYCGDDTSYDDVLIVQDRKVSIEGKSYTFMTALKNRRPALDLFEHESALGEYDIKALENETITITPYGVDPDDGTVTYGYAGWGEDYDERFDEACWQLELSNPSPDFMNCIVRIEEQPDPRWTSSALFVNTGKNAELGPLERSDLGYHTMRISVTDDAGLQDYQDIRILVFDLPVAVPQGRNLFDDVPDEFASIEDSYILLGNASRASTVASTYGGSEAISSYQWKGGIAGSDPEFTILFRRSVVTFPDDVAALFNNPGQIYVEPLDREFWEYLPFHRLGTSFLGPDDITRVPFTNPPRVFPAAYNLSLKVESGEFFSDPADLSVTLLACLPHSGEDAPYPYSSFGDPDADHTCCLGDIVIDPITGEYDASSVRIATAADNIDCYTASDYSILAMFQSSVTNHYGLSRYAVDPPNPVRTEYHLLNGTVISGDVASQDLLFRLGNDPFRRDVVRKCDGLRGNTCTGDVVIEYHQLDVCDDTLVSGQAERCDGATPYYSWYYRPRTSITDSYRSCTTTRYRSTFSTPTFEFAFRDRGILTRAGTTPTGHCSSEQHCTTYGTSNFNLATRLPTGPSLCWIGCNGAGSCSTAMDCICNLTCGAQCETGGYSYDESTSICSHNCNPITCTYDDTAAVCHRNCMTTSSVFVSASDCSSNNRNNPAVNSYCYHLSESDGVPCGPNGCVYPSPTLVPAGTCQVCTNAGPVIAGNPCPVAASGTELGGMCYFGVPTCTPHCVMNSAPMPTCPPGETPACTPSGPDCS